jgi:hypothetical protein
MAYDNSASSSSLRFCVCLTRAHGGVGAVPNSAYQQADIQRRGPQGITQVPFLTSYSSAQQSNLSFIYFTFWFYCIFIFLSIK